MPQSVHKHFFFFFFLKKKKLLSSYFLTGWTPHNLGAGSVGNHKTLPSLMMMWADILGAKKVSSFGKPGA